MFTDEIFKNERITLNENNRVVSEESELNEKPRDNDITIISLNNWHCYFKNNNIEILKASSYSNLKVILRKIDSTNNFSFDLINS